ncbi:hypothetical protein CS535_18180 [Yersinia massiliensis]|nr:hypothetical protein CS535_18180 [Yersinia massiliensis]
MNNLEELKKAALGANLHGWTGFEDALNDDGYSEAVSKFIGHCRPSEILALIAQLEAAQKERDDLLNQEFQQRLANAEHQLYMKDLAIHNLKASRKAQFRKRLAAEAALSVVQNELDNESDILIDVMDSMREWKLRAKTAEAALSAANQKLAQPVVLSSSTVMSRACAVRAIKAAGFTVEGGE